MMLKSGLSVVNFKVECVGSFGLGNNVSTKIITIQHVKFDMATLLTHSLTHPLHAEWRIRPQVSVTCFFAWSRLLALRLTPSLEGQGAV